MASPQLEHGYVKIANEILDALCHIRISGEARQVLDTIIRKTYGYHKKQDRISLSQFCISTGLRKVTICKAISKLKKMNLILITNKDNDKANVFIFNKDFDTWKALPKKVTLPKKVIDVTKKGNKTLPKKGTTKDIYTKDNITKDIAETSSALIVEIIHLFEGINPACKRLYGNKTQRKASQDLIDTYGFEEISRVITWLPKTNKMTWFPTINTPLQLWDRYQDLKDKVAKEKSKLKANQREVIL